MFVVWSDERLESSAVVPSAGADETATGAASLCKPKLAPIASCETLTDSCDLNTAVAVAAAVGAGAVDSAESCSGGSSPRDSVSDDSGTLSALVSVTASTTSDQQQRHRTTTTTTTINSRRLQLATTTTLDSLSVLSADELSAAASSDTLVPCSPARSAAISSSDLSSCTAATLTAAHTPTQSTTTGLKRSLAALLLVNFRGSSTATAAAAGAGSGGRKSRAGSTSPIDNHQLNALALSPATSPKLGQSPLSAVRRLASPTMTHGDGSMAARRATSPSPLHRSPVTSPQLHRSASPISYSYSSPNIISHLPKSRAACTYRSHFSLTKHCAAVAPLICNLK